MCPTLKNQWTQIMSVFCRRRDYEFGLGQELSLNQLSWCERNLNSSLQRVMARMEFLQVNQIKQSQHQADPYSSPYDGNGPLPILANPDAAKIPMQFDQNPYRVPQGVFQHLFDQGKHTSNGSYLGSLSTPNFSFQSNVSNFAIQQSPSIFRPEVVTMSDIQIPSIPNSLENFLWCGNTFHRLA